ncbi:putative permease [Thermanaerovibrio velox DSM 12556]|uniref:Putative permease n=1 Tax=Thermanaerovibrio velox DSM 12556 TaxID=926567 RepID=H0UR77_9BACT|nr:hypothetical protein [Thermanaerovibrio velox]EHM09833.1 putative permease [Thermanaerovibrio velox DSM 12556]
MFPWILYAVAGFALCISYVKDRERTRKGVLKALRAFEGILPQLLGVLLLIGIGMTLLNPSAIAALLGKQSGVSGVLLALLIGSITLMPGFVAFPLASAMVKAGAGYAQMGAFVSSLMMVGVVTFPMEAKILGVRLALWRNLLSLVLSFFIALVLGRVMG